MSPSANMAAVLREARLATVDPVGLIDIAVRLDVAIDTPQKWAQRGVLPDPRWYVSGGPVWDWTDIVDWCKATGRHNPYGLT
jgi:hypothetical protein